MYVGKKQGKPHTIKPNYTASMTDVPTLTKGPVHPRNTNNNINKKSKLQKPYKIYHINIYLETDVALSSGDVYLSCAQFSNPLCAAPPTTQV